MVKGIINAFDHMEYCLVINLTIGGNQAVTWPPIIATRNVSLATTLNTCTNVPGSKYLLPTEKINF